MFLNSQKCSWKAPWPWHQSPAHFGMVYLCLLLQVLVFKLPCTRNHVSPLVWAVASQEVFHLYWLSPPEGRGVMLRRCHCQPYKWAMFEPRAQAACIHSSFCSETYCEQGCAFTTFGNISFVFPFPFFFFFSWPFDITRSCYHHCCCTHLLRETLLLGKASLEWTFQLLSISNYFWATYMPQLKHLCCNRLAQQHLYFVKRQTSWMGEIAI